MYDEEFLSPKLELLSDSARPLDVNSVQSAPQLHSLLKTHDIPQQVNTSINAEQTSVKTINTIAPHSDMHIINLSPAQQIQP